MYVKFVVIPVNYETPHGSEHYVMNIMSNIIPFKKLEANTEPIIYSDYWEEKISLFEILEAHKQATKEKDNGTT
jgi:hypothetical protein